MNQNRKLKFTSTEIKMECTVHSIKDKTKKGQLLCKNSDLQPYLTYMFLSVRGLLKSLFTPFFTQVF